MDPNVTQGLISILRRKRENELARFRGEVAARRARHRRAVLTAQEAAAARARLLTERKRERTARRDGRMAQIEARRRARARR